MRTFKFFLLAAVVALAGCAGMSSQECAYSDWQSVGYEDGASGKAADAVGNRRKACAKHGVAIDYEGYREGWDRGVRAFCNPQRGYDIGSRGGSYHGQCPAELDEDFVVAYRAGRQLHQLTSSVSAAQNQIRYKEVELKKVVDGIQDAEAALISNDSTPEERIRHLNELNEMAERKGELEAEIVALEREKAMREQRLSDYRSANNYSYDPYQ